MPSRIVRVRCHKLLSCGKGLGLFMIGIQKTCVLTHYGAVTWSLGYRRLEFLLGLGKSFFRAVELAQRYVNRWVRRGQFHCSCQFRLGFLRLPLPEQNLSKQEMVARIFLVLVHKLLGVNLRNREVALGHVQLCQGPQSNRESR